MHLLREGGLKLRTFFGDMRTRVARHAPWLWFALFALAVSYRYTDPAPERLPPTRPEAHGDGNYYYAYLRSLVFDHDLELNNDYGLLGDQFNAGIHPETKQARNVFTVGPALFWLPLVPVAELGQSLSHALGAPEARLDGTESLYQRSVLFGSVLAGLITTALGLALARRITDPGLATLSAIGLCLGSPLIWYMLRQPSFSHAIDSCAIALFAGTWLVSFGVHTTLRWLGIGALLGLAMLVRPQNVTHALLPLGEWLLLSFSLARARDLRGLLRAVGHGFLFVFTALLVAAPLFLIWRRMYGGFVLVPQGASFMDWANSRWDATLFASRGGLFAFHPLLLVGALGLVALASLRRFGRPLRVLACMSLLVLGVQAFINGAANDWWGGWAFGGRRFLSCTLYLMLGLATALELVRGFATRHTRGFIQSVVAAGLLAVALYNRSLGDDFMHGHMPPDGAQSMKPRYGAALQKTLDEVYAITGNPGSLPASLVFAARAGTTPDRYDLAAANDMLGFELARGRFFRFDDFHAFRGFSPADEDHLGHPTRKVSDKRATWLFVLRKRMALSGELTLASSKPGVRAQMFVGKTKFFDHKLSSGWKSYSFDIPEEATRTGNNYVNVTLRLPKGEFVAFLNGSLRGTFPLPALEE